MKLSSKYFSALVSMIIGTSCVQRYPPPVSPPYPFEVGGYSIFVDEEPGHYDVITIGDRKYCYFSKKMDDDDELFIEDKDCDLHGDKVVVLSKDNNIILRHEFKRLPKITTQYLDYILQKHEKHILKDDAITF